MFLSNQFFYSQIVDELIGIISCDRTPMAGLPIDNRPIIDPFLQEHLSHFSLVTHGFGCIALTSSLGIARSIIDEAITFLDRTNAHFAPFPQHKIM